MPQPPPGNGVNDRRTPRDLFDRLNEEFDFTLDGAASHENALVSRYCTLEGTFEQRLLISTADGLNFPWGRAEIRFLKGRVKYDGLGAAPFPSMGVIWRGLQDNSQAPLLEIPGGDE